MLVDVISGDISIAFSLGSDLVFLRNKKIVSDLSFCCRMLGSDRWFIDGQRYVVKFYESEIAIEIRLSTIIK